MIPQLANIGPTTRRPAGPPSALAVITAVITFARSASGGRVESRPMIGALTSGTNTPQASRTTPTASHGRVATSAQSGSTTSTIAPAASRSGENRSSAFIASTLPPTAPIPKAANSQPTIFASWPKRR